MIVFYQVLVLAAGGIAYLMLKRLKLRKDELVIKLEPGIVAKPREASLSFKEFAKDMLISSGYVCASRYIEKFAFEKLGIVRCASICKQKAGAKELTVFVRSYEEIMHCLFSKCSVLHAYLLDYKLRVVYA